MTNPSNAIMVYGLWGFRFFAKQNRVLPPFDCPQGGRSG